MIDPPPQTDAEKIEILEADLEHTQSVIDELNEHIQYLQNVERPLLNQQQAEIRRSLAHLRGQGGGRGVPGPP